MDNNEIRNELIKMTPPAGVSLTSFLGVPLSDWVYVATIIYILIQCCGLIYKTFCKKKGDEIDGNVSR